MAGELQRVPETSSNVEILKHAITINQLISRYRDTGVSLDHGDLVGLSDDDHPQYYNAARLTTALSGYVQTSALNELVDDRVAALAVAGTGISITYNDVGNTLTFAVSGLTSGNISDFNEAVDDRVSSLLQAGSNITLTYNDGANTLTVAVSGLTSAQISDFNEAVDDRVDALVVAGDGIAKVYNDGANTYTLSLDINELTAEASVDAANDYFVMYDASAAALRKVLGSNLPGGVGGGSVATDTIWDVKGDLAVGTGSNTASRLAAGTNGTILSADSAEPTGLKWITPTSLVAVNDGARISDSGTQSINHNVTSPKTALTFNTEDRDDNGYANLGTNNTRLTVPATGWYVVSAWLQWDSNGTGVREVGLYLNGGSTPFVAQVVSANTSVGYATNEVNAIRYLTAGDYIEARVYQTKGSAENVLAGKWMAIHRISGGSTLASSSAPATASSSGTAGQIAYDSSYLYVCTAANTWKRVAISTW